MTAYAARPRWLFMSVRYVNDGEAPLAVTGSISHRYVLNPLRDGKEPAFWSYQSATYDRRPDWVLPVPLGYARNFLGMNEADYGGGTPVLDVWRRDLGLAVGHVELVPKHVSLPVRRRAKAAPSRPRCGDQPPATRRHLDTLPRFVAVHHGDYFDVLRAYSQLMQAQGLTLPHPQTTPTTPSGAPGATGASSRPTGVRDATGREAAGVPLGGPRRWLADGRAATGRPSDESPRATPT